MSAPLSEQHLAEIRARVDCIAPGPWTVEYDGCDCTDSCADQLAVGFGPFTSVENTHRDVTPEAEFAAAARQDVPALLAEVARLRARNADIEVEIRKLVRWHEEDARQIKTWGRRVAKSQQQDAHRRAEVLAEAAGLIEAWQHDADDAAALDHGALTDTETAAHIAVHRAATHLRNLAGGEPQREVIDPDRGTEPDPTDPPEYRYCGAILVGRTEWPRTCHRRIRHDGPCGPQTDAEGGEPRG